MSDHHATPDRILAARRGVIFDLDGTLVDTSADIAAAANAARRALRLPPLTARVTIGYVGDGVQLLLQRVLGHDPATGRVARPVAPDDLQTAMQHFAAHYAAHLLDHTRLYPRIDELLHVLGDRPLFVATNKPRDFSLAILAGLGIDGRFARVVGGDDAPARKPDPAHLAACLAGTGLAPDEVVVVGDSPNDVLAARAFGCPSIAVAWGLVPAANLAAAAPDALAADVPRLARLLGVAL